MDAKKYNNGKEIKKVRKKKKIFQKGHCTVPPLTSSSLPLLLWLAGVGDADLDLLTQWNLPAYFTVLSTCGLLLSIGVGSRG